MDIWETMQSRHSVRQYLDRPIEKRTVETLRADIRAVNGESGLHIQLLTDEADAFNGSMARYGKFQNVKNYIALVGPKGKGLAEKCGYWGEKIVLRAQELGLNTCWVAMTYSRGKTAALVNPAEKLLMVISIGYGQTQGAAHAVKPLEELYRAKGPAPAWFLSGVRAAQLAPTAVNQQKFCFELVKTDVRAHAGSGFYTDVDLGIAKYHFEQGAGKEGWRWL